MPNHFHLMIYVHTIEIPVDSEGVTPSDALTKVRTINESVGNHYRDSLSPREAISKNRTLNDSIGYLIRSFTQAINKQEKRTGSLFKAHTKAECLTKIQGITPSFFGSQINVRIPEKEYPQVCFNYIHQNPVKASLVKRPEEWEFSSYRDYYGFRNGKLINRARAAEFELINNG